MADKYGNPKKKSKEKSRRKKKNDDIRVIRERENTKSKAHNFETISPQKDSGRAEFFENFKPQNNNVKRQNNRDKKPVNTKGNKPKNIYDDEFFGKNVIGNKAYKDDEYYNKNDIRKNQKKRRGSASKKARRWKMIITYSALLAVVVVAGVTLSLTVFFKTEEYEISGKTRYSKQEIVSACGIEQGENIFLADKDWAEENIKNAFPYIADVNVSFGLPDKIVIDITEGKASYMVKYADKDFCIVSQEGRILNNSQKKVSGLPLIKGVKLESNVDGTYVEYNNDTIRDALDEIITTINGTDFKGITEINVKNKAKLTMTYDKRILVELGVPEDLTYKIKTAKAIITDKLDPNNVGTIEGTLDVSQCNETKRSYFNEKSIVATAQPASTTESTESTTSPIVATDSYTDYNNGYDYQAPVTDYQTPATDYIDNGYAGDGYGNQDYAGAGDTQDYGYAGNYVSDSTDVVSYQ